MDRLEFVISVLPRDVARLLADGMLESFIDAVLTDLHEKVIPNHQVPMSVGFRRID